MTCRREFIGMGLSVSTGVLGGVGNSPQLTLEEASDMVRRGRVSPVELTRGALDRIAQWNGKLNAFITITGESALEEARRAEAEIKAGQWRGPLHGLPIALKDLIDTAGIRTTAGSAQFADRVPYQDAEVWRQLRKSGAILVGKLNMDEFAYNFTSETSYFGTSRNPWDVSRSPGGSSGGAAIAVAAGMCLGAVGSDTGGSIRLPASLCGISGFKPTYGRVSTSGAAPLAWSLDHVGPMCRSARGCRLMFTAMGGEKLAEAATRQVRLGIPLQPYYENLDFEVEQCVRKAANELGRALGGVQEVKLPPLIRALNWPDLPATYATVISAEAYTYHERMLADHPERYHPGTRASIEGGKAVTAPDYIRARRDMDQLRAQSDLLFEAADVLLTPTAPGPAFGLGKPVSLVYLRNCAPWNLYGLPAISIPCGFTARGLPIGVQVIGRAGADEVVLAVAEEWQKLTDWHTRRPAIA